MSFRLAQHAVMTLSAPSKIILGMLPRHVRVSLIQQNACLAVRIREDAGRDLLTRADIDEQPSHRIGPVIETDGKFRHSLRSCVMGGEGRH